VGQHAEWDRISASAGKHLLLVTRRQLHTVLAVLSDSSASFSCDNDSCDSEHPGGVSGWSEDAKLMRARRRRKPPQNCATNLVSHCTDPAQNLALQLRHGLTCYANENADISAPILWFLFDSTDTVRPNANSPLTLLLSRLCRYQQNRPLQPTACSISQNEQFRMARRLCC
jgi:hypothetical protein